MLYFTGGFSLQEAHSTVLDTSSLALHLGGGAAEHHVETLLCSQKQNSHVNAILYLG